MKHLKELYKRFQYRKKCNSFYAQFIKPGGLVFDIGANMGDKTRLFSRLAGNKGKVIAVEPQGSCMRELTSRFLAKKNVELVKKAVGRTNNMMEMYICNVDSLSTLSKDWISKAKEYSRFIEDVDWSKTEKVEVIALDALISTYGIPEFIKIDVEGYEKEVVSGLTKKIQSFISLEFVPESTDNTRQCLEYLQGLGRIGCNYSLDGSMELALSNWSSIDEVIERISALEKGRDWGDVYIRLG